MAEIKSTWCRVVSHKRCADGTFSIQEFKRDGVGVRKNTKEYMSTWGLGGARRWGGGRVVTNARRHRFLEASRCWLWLMRPSSGMLGGATGSMVRVVHFNSSAVRCKCISPECRCLSATYHINARQTVVGVLPCIAGDVFSTSQTRWPTGMNESISAFPPPPLFLS